MKKIILFLLALTYAIPTRALNSYTDYQFVGYVEEMKEDEELYKYESVTFNKYYELVEEEMGYYEIGSIEDYSSIDMEDKISLDVTSLTPDKNKTATYEIAIDNPNNFASTSLSVLNIKNHENVKIKEIEMYSNGKKLSVSPMIVQFADGDYENYTPLEVNRFELYYKKSYLNQLSMVIYYDQEEDLEFQLHLKGMSDSQYFDKDIVLNKDFKKVTINILSSTIFDNFKIFNNLEGESILHYYKYTADKYMHYRWNKKYCLDDEEGLHPEYSYDPQESYTMYKEYKRELIEEEPNVPSQEEKDDPNNQGEDNDKKEEGEIPTDKDDLSGDENKDNSSNEPNDEEAPPITPDPPKEEVRPQKPTVIVIPSNPPKKEEQDNIEETDKDLENNEKGEGNIPAEDSTDKVEDHNEETSDTEVLAFNNEQPPKTEEKHIPTTTPSTIAKEEVDEIVDKVDTDEDKTTDLSSSLESCECEDDPSTFTIIGTFLIFISLILDIIYFINVKKKKE